MSLPWIKKYEPKKISDIKGQDNAIAKLKSFVSDYGKGKKACLLYGETGNGKTISVHALANELNFEIIEVNASDFRNKDKIDSVIGSAIKQMSLFAKSKIILIDEIDGLSGNKDRGGIQEITKLLTDCTFPVIMTANNPWEQKFNSLRSKCEMIEFVPLDNKDVFSVLKKICDNEKISYSEEVLKTFSRRVGSDLRAGINDLQTLTNDKKLTKDVLDELNDRNKTEKITSALMKIFKTTDASVALSALDNVNEDMDKCILWIDENLPKEYTMPEDLSRAYEKLSKADIFNSRIRRRQYWRLLVYVNALLSAGIATSKNEKYKQFVEYEPTKRILKLWQANMKYQKRKGIAEKIAFLTHSSKKDALKDSLPFIKVMIESDKKLGGLISKELDLNDEEIEWMKK